MINIPQISANPTSLADNKDIVKTESTVTTEQVVKKVEKVVEQVTHLAGASLNPEIAKNYSIASYIPPTTPVPEIQEQKTVVDSHVEELEKRISALAAEKEVKAESDRKKRSQDLKKKLQVLKNTLNQWKSF